MKVPLLMLYPLKVVEGFGVSEVLDSDDANFKTGDIVSGITFWEDYSLMNKRSIQLRKLQPDNLPLSFHVGLLGMFSSSVYKAVLHTWKYVVLFFSWQYEIENTNMTPLPSGLNCISY